MLRQAASHREREDTGPGGAYMAPWRCIRGPMEMYGPVVRHVEKVSMC